MRKHLRWTKLDDLAHWFYAPTLHGARAARARWHHHIHLIPGWLLRRVCGRYDLSLGMSREDLARVGPADFYEHDEPTESVRAAYDRGVKGLTRRPAMVTLGCEHVTMAGPLAPGTVNAWCGCELREVIGNG